jgi:hypothetical protein
MAKKTKTSSSLYWTGRLHLPGVGIVSGEALPEHVEIFDRITSGVGVVRSNYLSEEPPAPPRQRTSIA